MKYDAENADMMVADAIHRGVLTEADAGPEIVGLLPSRLASPHERDATWTMQLTEFETRLLYALVEGDPEQGVLEEQVRTATVERREFTGHGLYVELCVAASSGRLRNAARSTIASPHLALDHPSMPNGAGAMLWLEEGRIATIECYGFDDAWALDDTQFVITKGSPG